jgi:DNA polymerase (family 10)
MTNKQIANFLYEIADMLDLKGDDSFRINAYKQAGRAIEYFGMDVEDLFLEKGIKGLLEIPGVGESIAQKIAEYIQFGKCKYYDDLKKDIAVVELQMMKIPQIGPKIARRLFQELNIKSLEDLEKKAKAGEIRKLKGFGVKVEENILKNLQRLKKTEKRMLLSFAEKLAQQVIDYLKTCPQALKIYPVGSLRRMKETIGDIDIIVSSSNPQAVIDFFCNFPAKKEVIAKGDTKASILHKIEDTRIDLEVLEEENFGSLLQHLTGSKDHNIQLRTYAKKLGLSLSEYGILDTETQKRETFKDEASFYKRLGLDYIPPELREARGEIEAARKHSLPSLVEINDIKGDLHLHSRWSEGILTVEELAELAFLKGYLYIGICDHTSGLGIAKGVDHKIIEKQIKEIDSVNEKFKNKIRILKGVEVNIRADGSLDLPDFSLAKLDFAIASVHWAFRQDEATMTQRIIKAMKNPYVKILGHPSGRLIFKREAYNVDWGKIFRAARQYNVAMEINSQPERLDLNDGLILEARKYNLLFVVNTDNHNKDDLEEM